MPPKRSVFSAKTGPGIVETLEASVHKLPAPGHAGRALKAMLVDSLVRQLSGCDRFWLRIMDCS